MDLLKQLSEDIKSYNTHFETIIEQIEQFEQEIAQEKRLGLSETEYYHQDRSQQQAPANDTVDFQAPGEPVAKPVQHPNANRSLQRIHLIYDPSKGKVVNAIKTDSRSRPPADFVEANSQQVADAMKHIQNLSPDTAEKMRNGQINIWIPRAQSAPAGSNMLQSTGTGGGINKANMDPGRLAAAQQAASKMSFS